MAKYTVKDLKEYLKDVPDDYEVVYERIEDVYFEKHNWITIDTMEQIKTNGEWKDYLPHSFISTFSCYQWPEHKLCCITAHY
jgi:hypothetical protein